MDWFLIKDIRKDTSEQLDEEVQRVSPARVSSTGASVPVELGSPPSWHVDVFTNSEAL